MRRVSSAVCALLAWAMVGCDGDESGDLERGQMDDGPQSGTDAARLLDAATQSGDARGAEACAQLSLSECAPERCSMLSARRVDLVHWCTGAAYEPVGCMNQGMGCTGALTLATDPSGNLWQFTSGCLPRGWQASPILSGRTLYASALPDGGNRDCTSADAGR